MRLGSELGTAARRGQLRSSEHRAPLPDGNQSPHFRRPFGEILEHGIDLVLPLLVASKLRLESRVGSSVRESREPDKVLISFDQFWLENAPESAEVADPGARGERGEWTSSRFVHSRHDRVVTIVLEINCHVKRDG